MRCCAHKLNLIVKDGLEVIKKGIENIRDSVEYWTASPKRYEKFEEMVCQIRVNCTKKMGLDCPTRWNSTFLMLETALIYKDVFARLKQRETGFKCCPSDNDWILGQEVCHRLKLFYTVTEIFYGTKFSIANLYFPKICDVKLELLK